MGDFGENEEGPTGQPNCFQQVGVTNAQILNALGMQHQHQHPASANSVCEMIERAAALRRPDLLRAPLSPPRAPPPTPSQCTKRAPRKRSHSPLPRRVFASSPGEILFSIRSLLNCLSESENEASHSDD